MTSKTKAHLAVFSANLIYGANYNIAKVVMPELIQPNGFVLLRVFFATLLFFFMRILYKSSVTKMDRKDVFRFFLLGLFGVAINQLLFFQGLSLTSNINAALIMTSNPVIVVLIAGILISERITLIRLIGILLGVIGAVSLITLSQSHGVGSFSGDLMIFINAASYAVFIVMVKPMMKKYDPWFVLCWTFFFGLLIVIPFGINDVAAIQWEAFNVIHWSAIIFVIFFTTFLAYLLNTLALKELSTAVVSYYIYLQPIFATIITLYIMHEPVKWIHAVACVLIFTGVYLVSNPTFGKAKS